LLHLHNPSDSVLEQFSFFCSASLLSPLETSESLLLQKIQPTFQNPNNFRLLSAPDGILFRSVLPSQRHFRIAQHPNPADDLHHELCNDSNDNIHGVESQRCHQAHSRHRLHPGRLPQLRNRRIRRPEIQNEDRLPHPVLHPSVVHRDRFCHVHAKFQIVQSGTGFGNILHFGVGTHQFFKRTPGVSVRRDLHHFVREMLHSSGKNFERSD
jgi:hypothetical protein